ncbi:MAG TPA: peptide chain release factor N(5)-glutamine methyltransferase [Phycisphaerae bacterium]|jgi:release factor glutamine methyltransferase|nr:peptide chain release factor N(5)-glutamine methyltransferase [Phycisphaerae bacterium]
MASTPVWTIGSLLTATTDFFTKRSIDDARLSAELLLAHVLNCSRMALYTQYERIPSDAQRDAFRALVKERANHVPVAYLIGKAWFFSLEFNVTRDVLIPRPDTETLVEFVVQHARQRPEWSAPGGGPAILDLCTGSGIIPIALAKSLPAATFTATDISPKALDVASGNAELHKLQDRIQFLEGDLFTPLESVPAPTLFHAITANPPYIPTAEIANLPATVRDHEPRLALDGGLDGMALHRRIAGEAKKYLHPGGLIIVEMQFDQGPALQALFAAAGHFQNIRVIRDAAGHPRCLAALLAPA